MKKSKNQRLKLKYKSNYSLGLNLKYPLKPKHPTIFNHPLLLTIPALISKNPRLNLYFSYLKSPLKPKHPTIFKHPAILALLAVILLLLPAAYPITIQELINSYNYTYSSGQLNITKVSYYGNDADGDLLYDTLVIEIDLTSTEGNYTFIGDLYKGNQLIAAIGDAYQLGNGENKILLYYSPKLLQSGTYNLSLTVQQKYLTVYKKDNLYSLDFDNTQYEKPEVKIELKSYELINTDIDSKYEILRVNAALDSEIEGKFEINALASDSRAISSKMNYSIVKGVNNINIDFDGKDIRKERLNNSKLYLITIKNGVSYQFEFNYPLTYNLYDFDAGQSVLDSYSDAKVDLNDNSLAEFLELNLGLWINESGIYEVELGLADLYGDSVKKMANKFSLDNGEQSVSFRINGSDIYSSRINGPYLLDYVRLSKDAVLLDSASKPYTTGSYNYDEFEPPLMPDLTIRALEAEEENKDGIKEQSIRLDIANEGDSYGFGFELELFDDSFNSLGKKQIDYLAPHSLESVVYYNVYSANNETPGAPGISAAKKLYAVIDYGNEVEESNESNNLFTKELKKMIKLNITLNKGWNLISFPLEPTNKTLPEPLNSIEGDYSMIFSYSNGKWRELKDNDEINKSLGYWIELNENAVLEVEGTALSSPGYSDNSDNLLDFLKPEWSLVSYYTLYNAYSALYNALIPLNLTSLNLTLDTPSDIILLNENLSEVLRERNINLLVLGWNNGKWLSYSSKRPYHLNTLTNLTAGNGYWVVVR